MDLQQELQRQAVIEDLVRSLRVPQDKKTHIGIVLYERNIYDLFKGMRDLAAVKEKLSGKRVILTSKQKELAVVVEYLTDFDDTIGSWVTSLHEGDRAYAVEHVLGSYDAATHRFGNQGTGTGSDLVKKLDFGELQVLKKYSRFASILEKLYGYAGLSDTSFSEDANSVAISLVGKLIKVPVHESTKMPKDKYVAIIETEGYQTDEEVSKSRYCMIASPGEFRTMPFRGLNLLNVGTLKTGTPSCVMIRSVAIDGQFVEGPGRVGNVLNVQQLEGKILGKEIELTGKTAKSGYIPGAGDYSTGRYRVQEPLR